MVSLWCFNGIYIGGRTNLNSLWLFMFLSGKQGWLYLKNDQFVNRKPTF